MKRLTPVLAILLGTMFLGTPAMASDAPPQEEATAVAEPAQEPVAPAPEPEVEAPAPAPEPEAQAPAPVEDVQAPTEETETKTVKPPKEPKVWICHPVNGKGETGNGWNLIKPAQASSHIDDQGNPKHTSKDGRVDTPAVDGACPTTPVDEEPPAFEEYEVDVCWKMDNPDGVEGTYEWPQTRVEGAACDAVPECEEIAEYQHDTYWIRDKADEDYLAGLDVLNSPADDASLEPHDYFGTLKEGGECEEPPTEGPIYITVAAPKIHQPTCDDPEVRVDFITDGDHYDGFVDYPPYSSAPNVVNVIAFAHDGVDFGPVGGPLYEIKGPGYWELKIDKSGLKNCDKSIGTPASLDLPNDDQMLPDTGGADLALGLGGLAAVAVGGVLLLGRRRTA